MTHICNYHQDSIGWDTCSDDFEGECDIAKLKATNAALVEALEAVQAHAKSLHTMKGLKVWATMENRERKHSMIDLIDAALAKAKESTP